MAYQDASLGCVRNAAPVIRDRFWPDDGCRCVGSLFLNRGNGAGRGLGLYEAEATLMSMDVCRDGTISSADPALAASTA